MPARDYMPHGVIPACIMPFGGDFEIDEKAYRRHLRDLADVDGVTAITINGHAAEVYALSDGEQRRAIEIARDELGHTTPVIVGISADASLQAGRLARMADEAGADCLLVLPPESLRLGGQQRPDMAFEHFRHVAGATDLPLIVFQYPIPGALGYAPKTVAGICRRFPSVVAVKDWSNDGALHERLVRDLRALDRPIRVLSSHSAWLLGSLVLGSDGVLSGAGSVIANLHVALWRAVQANDLSAAKAVNDRIYPTVRAFYDPPFLDAHNRMKEALVLLGRLDAAHVRPPLKKLGEDEIHRIGQWLAQAGLTRHNVYAALT